jgi:hypothetical protein
MGDRACIYVYYPDNYYVKWTGRSMQEVLGWAVVGLSRIIELTKSEVGFLRYIQPIMNKLWDIHNSYPYDVNY